jgi:hypothetical protein
MKTFRKIPSLQVKIHVMDNVKEKRQFLHMNSISNFVEYDASYFSKNLNSWIYSNNQKLYDEKHKILDTVENILFITEIKSDCILFHHNGYTLFDTSSKEIVSIDLHAELLGISNKHKLVFFEDMSFVYVIDLFSGNKTGFAKEDNTYICISMDLNDNLYCIYIQNTKLKINNTVYKIPECVLSESYYVVAFDNEKFTLVTVQNGDWYILFDKSTKSFSKWIYLENARNIYYLSCVNKVLLQYKNMFLILKNKDFSNLFESVSIKELLYTIDKGCESMVYFIDKYSLFRLNNDESYIYYICNNQLMATMTCPPYKMHIVCQLNKKVIHLNVSDFDVLLQYDDLTSTVITF